MAKLPRPFPLIGHDTLHARTGLGNVLCLRMPTDALQIMVGSLRDSLCSSLPAMSCSAMGLHGQQTYPWHLPCHCMLRHARLHGSNMSCNSFPVLLSLKAMHCVDAIVDHMPHLLCRRDWHITGSFPWQVPLLGLAQGPINNSSATAANNPLAIKSYSRRTTQGSGAAAAAAGSTGSVGLKAVAAVAALKTAAAAGRSASVSKAPASPTSPSAKATNAAGKHSNDIPISHFAAWGIIIMHL